MLASSLLFKTQDWVLLPAKRRHDFLVCQYTELDAMNDALGHANLELDELLQIRIEKGLASMLAQTIALDCQLLIVGD